MEGFALLSKSVTDYLVIILGDSKIPLISPLFPNKANNAPMIKPYPSPGL
jgi:hypothetical protein